MGHGNFSDMIFLALSAIVIQWFFFPDTLYEDIGPLKAQFHKDSSDLEAIIKFGGALLLMIACAFSGVRWNPTNGKMAGMAIFIATGYTAYSVFKADAYVFVPCLLYIYVAVLFLGGLHIFAFPSNPMPKKNPEAKSNHGNFSDLVALSLMIASLCWYFYPDHLFQDLGPLKAQFHPSSQSPDMTLMIKFVAGLMLVIALLLSGVKWNPINGKLAGMGGFVASGIITYRSFTGDGGVFVPRLFYIYAALIFLGALHIFAFPSNPTIVKESKGDEALLPNE